MLKIILYAIYFFILIYLFIIYRDLLSSLDSSIVTMHDISHPGDFRSEINIEVTWKFKSLFY